MCCFVRVGLMILLAAMLYIYIYLRYARQTVYTRSRHYSTHKTRHLSASVVVVSSARTHTAAPPSMTHEWLARMLSRKVHITYTTTIHRTKCWSFMSVPFTIYTHDYTTRATQHTFSRRECPHTMRVRCDARVAGATFYMDSIIMLFAENKIGALLIPRVG